MKTGDVVLTACLYLHTNTAVSGFCKEKEKQTNKQTNNQKTKKQQNNKKQKQIYSF